MALPADGDAAEKQDMKAFHEVGVRRLARFLWVTLALTAFRVAIVPPFRSLFLRVCGASVGADTVLHRLTLINVDRGGFRSLRIGARCFLGDEVLIDLAAPVTLEDDVTLAARAMILTHLNVGYSDHPLQRRFPSMTAPVTIRRGSFVGAGATVLAGCSLGPEAFVGAGSLVNRDVQGGETVGGVPIRPIGPTPHSATAD
jgi:acetyltransferase-like isoleucine patch superfamily enzyme